MINYGHPWVLAKIRAIESRLCPEDVRTFRDEVFAELYDYMPQTMHETMEILDAIGGRIDI